MLRELYGLHAQIELFIAKTSWPVEFTAELAAFVLLLSFIGLFNLENHSPRLKNSLKNNRQSYRTNIGLFMFNSILMSLCSVSTLFLIAERYSGYGLLSHVNNPVLKLVLAFISIDVALYAWHYLSHRYDTLWLLHRVHHNDPNVNVSTAFRLHFVEILLTNLLKALVIVGMGIDKKMVLVIETLVTFSIMFHHTNISFWGERIIGRVLIVPFLHRLHHSTERAEHDTNYGAVLSVWDRLFQTIKEAEPKAIGIKGDSPQDVIGLVKFGFGVYKPIPAIPAEIDLMIAEAAYYRAQKRNFNPGNDLGDWYEAKADILAKVGCAKQQKNGLISNAIACLNQYFLIKHNPQFGL